MIEYTCFTLIIHFSHLYGIPDANESPRPHQPTGRQLGSTPKQGNHLMNDSLAHAHTLTKTYCKSVRKDGSPCQAKVHNDLDAPNSAVINHQPVSTP